jgi:ABC-type molybdenum transport system ATPase subunit/photorepair protein PhrA
VVIKALTFSERKKIQKQMKRLPTTSRHYKPKQSDDTVTIVDVSPFTLVVGTMVLLDGTKFVIQQGSHYGLIGRNGSGKSSLLNQIYNMTSLDFHVEYVHQMEPASDDTLHTLLSSSQNLTTTTNEEILTGLDLNDVHKPIREFSGAATVCV